MNIAIIPARGGSKRIPRKNLRSFGGRPMIAQAIGVARASGLFEHVVVSTEDAEIARVAREWGGETPFARPAALADDHTPTVPVVMHAVQACRDLGWPVDYVCCIYPAVPFLQIDDLRAALELLKSSASPYCFAVTPFPSAIQRALRRDADGRVESFYPEYELARTQDLEPAFHDAGQFYWARGAVWLAGKPIHAGAIGHVVPPWRVVDIDTPQDWERAELLREFMDWSAR